MQSLCSGYPPAARVLRKTEYGRHHRLWTYHSARAQTYTIPPLNHDDDFGGDGGGGGGGGQMHVAIMTKAVQFS